MQSWNFTVVTSNSTLWREEPRIDEKGTLTLRTNNAVADGVEVQVTMTDNGGLRSTTTINNDGLTDPTPSDFHRHEPRVTRTTHDTLQVLQ
jgi:hypothetical protein